MSEEPKKLTFSSTRKDAWSEIQLSVLLYGESGIGKTSLIKTLPVQSDDQVGIITTEKGNLPLSQRDFQEVKVGNYIEAQGVIRDLFQQKDGLPFKYLVFESVSKLSQVEELRIDREGDLEGFAKWKELGDRIKTTMSGFLKLPCHKIVICGSKMMEQDMRMTPTLLVQGDCKNTLPYDFDEVWYLEKFKNEEGETDRRLTINHCGNVMAKSRISSRANLDIHQPADFSAIIKKIFGESA